MARDHPVRDPDGPDQTTDSVEEQPGADDSERGAMGRRSYLKMATATAIAAGVGASAANAASDDYEVIQARGQVIRIDSGETWENKLIDLGNGNDITIVAQGTNWTIRNVGVTGTWHHTTHDYIFSLADTGGGTSTFEHIYAGEGDPSASASERGGVVWVNPDHNGRLEVTNVNFNVEGALGIYGSAPGYNGNGGTIHIDGCYAHDCHHTAYRIADDGSSITNSVAYKTGDRSAARAVWVWDGYGSGSTIQNVDIITNGQGGGVVTRNSPNLDMSGVRTDDGTGTAGNPDHYVPAGCPQSPEEAASGGATDASDQSADDLPENTLTVTGAGDPTNYYVETSGELVSNPDRGDLQVHDEIDGTTATGWVTTTDHVDSFRFDGELVDVGFHQGSATVELNGEEIDPGAYGAEPLSQTLLVDGVGTTGGTRYEFTVSGAAEKSTVEGASIDDEDRIDSGNVTGSVAGWRDAFAFSGDLEELTVDGSARVYVDGERIDPADYGDEQPHVLTLVGNGSDASYEISVDGTIDPVAGDDAEQSATATSESTVEGSISSGAQRFQFSGAVSDVTFLGGSAHVYVDGDRIDPDAYGDQELLPNAIVIDGTGTDGQTDYSFTIDGEVITSSYRDASIDPDDQIEGTAVSGTVDDEIDAYWFDGDIDDFRLAGTASVDVEYDVRSE